ncbi:hypothetical protein N0V94_000134 [Neodidymelliopsis sp. IMI 364377]|nr:hypothetical protein N0V94_000134 [Neodidymelliopsis sp. IMI 364377]
MGFNEETHARFKRAFANAFSDKSLRDQAPIVENYVDQLMSKLQESTAKTMDLEHLMECISFDIGSDLSFGESFDSLKTGKVHPWVEVAKGFGKGLALIASINQYPPLERLLRFIIPKKVLQKMQGHAQMSSAMAQKRLATHTSRPDFVTPTKAHVDAKGGITGKEWDINLMILVFAASETVASALTAIFRHLVQHPGVLHRLTSELRATFSCEADVTIASTAQLPYLNAVINESLRIAPPVVIGVPRVVPAGGATVCGRHVPAGTYVAYNQHAANRQSYNFHAPNSFIPERFLSPAKGPSLYAKDNMAGFKPFGVGRHQCIGMKLAWAEMRVVVARVLWQLDIRLAEEGDVWDWGEQATYIFWEKRALSVSVTEREDDGE